MDKPVFAFIGLGIMGFPMAGHLARAGLPVRVFNRTQEKAALWQAQYAGEACASPAIAASGADIILLCVGNDDDVRSVFYGEQGIAAALQPGSLVVDHTTTSADLARELAEACRNQDAGFIDAPVSGGQPGAINGQLTIMCGGHPADFELVQPYLQHYAKRCMRMGDVGAGQLTKMVNQICIAGLLQGLAEGMLFAEKAGLAPQAVIDVISQGAAQSWQMENRHKTMIAGEYNHGFAVDWMVKDLDICLQEANRLGLHLDAAQLVRDYYAEIQTMGGGRWDTSSLYARLQTRHQREEQPE